MSDIFPGSDVISDIFRFEILVLPENRETPNWRVLRNDSQYSSARMKDGLL